jgi:hypothetical protein
MCSFLNFLFLDRAMCARECNNKTRFIALVDVCVSGHRTHLLSYLPRLLILARKHLPVEWCAVEAARPFSQVHAHACTSQRHELASAAPEPRPMG